MVATNAKLAKIQAYRLASRGHDAVARAIRPVHTTHDGDVVFTLATGEINAGFDTIANSMEIVVEEAIRNSVIFAETVNGIRGLYKRGN